MKLDAARKLGHEMGLTSDTECINNVFLHCGMMFPYSVVDRELEELQTDAEAQGIRFSRVCGDAILADGDPDEVCYMCKKLKEGAK